MSEDSKDHVEPIELPDIPEWLEWLKHIRACRSICRTLGRDCPEAVTLRANLQRARDAAAAASISNTTR